MNMSHFINMLQTASIGPQGTFLFGSSGGGGFVPKPNTWHGDDPNCTSDEQITPDTEEDSVPWFIKDPLRLEKEKTLVGKYFPGFQFTEDTNEIYITGKLKTFIWGTPFDVKIVYPKGFPEEAPRAYVVSPSLQGNPPHVYRLGHLCLFDKNDPPERRWTPDDTAALIIGWTAKWLNCYQYWLLVTKKKKWPENKKVKLA